MNNTEPYTSKILLVDDEKGILASLSRLLDEIDNFEVFAYDSAIDALTFLERTSVDLIISDMRMPKMDGATFLAKVAKRWPDTARIILTGFADMESTIRAINEGHISHYISKPWDDEKLVTKINEALELKHLRDENKKLINIKEQQRRQLQLLTEEQENIIQKRTEELRETAQQLDIAYKELQESYYQSIPVLSHIVELNERQKKHHAKRVASISKIICKQLGLADAQTRQIFIGALLHDIGKIGLEQGILSKKMPSLTPVELKRYQQHTLLGESTLLSFDPLKEASSVVRSHHERYDGKGFPDKLKNDAIPLGARVVAVANDYDNLQLPSNFLGTSLTSIQAHEYILKESGKRYDPTVVDAFDKVIDLVRSKFSSAKESILTLDQVIPGMKLGQDLVNHHGMVMLAAGRVLTEAHIKKLKQFEHAFETKLQIGIIQQTKTN